MLSCDEGEDEFFDSVSCISTGPEDLGCKCGESEFDVWLKEPQSVVQRRRSFLSEMGISEIPFRNYGLERITESGGAVLSSSLASCTDGGEDSLVACDREANTLANSMVDDMEPAQVFARNTVPEVDHSRPSPSKQDCEQCQVERSRNADAGKKKMKRWWSKTWKERKAMHLTELVKGDCKVQVTNAVKVKQNKKRCMEFTGVYMGQEIQAHKGCIVTMKFSTDGQFLATGGEDKILRIWHVTSVDASCKSFASGADNPKEHLSSFVTKRKRPVPVVIPEKVFQIEESPLQELHGHAGDILDLAWSNSNYILSSSMDNTVRLWQLGSSHSLHAFRHSNSVTCIQFNPVDEQYFISGSIDGKIRIWGVTERKVVSWVDVREAVTAVCYQPDGKGIVVGTASGTCCFYKISGSDLQLVAKLHIHGRKKNYCNGITGIQFSKESSERVLISSEDSKIRIFDGVDLVQKFKGLPKSGTQMSPAFTSTGRHIISLGEDHRVYAWNYDDTVHDPSSKTIKSVQACEYFSSEGVSVALPWSGLAPRQGEGGGNCIFRNHGRREQGGSWRKDSERFSLGGWFFMDGPCSRGSQTWPEEKLPIWNEAVAEDEHYHANPHHDVLQRKLHYSNLPSCLSDSWGLVIVTASLDGKIRTFQNYGLPIGL